MYRANFLAIYPCAEVGHLVWKFCSYIEIIMFAIRNSDPQTKAFVVINF